jgi:hypothetical protein
MPEERVPLVLIAAEIDDMRAVHLEPELRDRLGLVLDQGLERLQALILLSHYPSILSTQIDMMSGLRALEHVCERRAPTAR